MPPSARLEAGRSYSGAFEFDTVPATWTERRLARGAEKLAYPATDGEKWIDVNLAKHTMTAYVGSKVVYGPIRMVDGSHEKPTVVGTFHVYYKNPMMTMRGSNADGTTTRRRTCRGPLLPPRVRPARRTVADVLRLLRVARLRQPAGAGRQVGLRLRPLGTPVVTRR